MEIRNLNTFLHAASLQNITRAAAELGYSQSAVSVQIRQLEQELGVPLFDRIGKNVYLTDFGRSLVPYARSAVAAVAAVENFGKSGWNNNVTDYYAVLGGAIRVGITDSLFELLMKPLLPAYHARFPKVRVELLVDTTVNLTQLLQQGSIDAMCVIDDPLPPAQWHIRQQTEVPIVLAASPSHPLASRSEVPLRELSGSELIMMEQNAPYNRRFETLLAQHQVECEPFLRLPSASAARDLLLGGSYLSLLPWYTVRADVEAGRLKLLSVTGWDITQSVQMVLHRSKVLTPQIEGFLSELSRALADALTQPAP